MDTITFPYFKEFPRELKALIWEQHILDVEILHYKHVIVKVEQQSGALPTRVKNNISFELVPGSSFPSLSVSQQARALSLICLQTIGTFSNAHTATKKIYLPQFPSIYHLYCLDKDTLRVMVPEGFRQLILPSTSHYDQRRSSNHFDDTPRSYAHLLDLLEFNLSQLELLIDSNPVASLSAPVEFKESEFRAQSSTYGWGLARGIDGHIRAPYYRHDLKQMMNMAYSSASREKGKAKDIWPDIKVEIVQWQREPSAYVEGSLVRPVSRNSPRFSFPTW